MVTLPAKGTSLLYDIEFPPPSQKMQHHSSFWYSLRTAARDTYFLHSNESILMTSGNEMHIWHLKWMCCWQIELHFIVIWLGLGMWGALQMDWQVGRQAGNAVTQRQNTILKQNRDRYLKSSRPRVMTFTFSDRFVHVCVSLCPYVRVRVCDVCVCVPVSDGQRVTEWDLSLTCSG